MTQLKKRSVLELVEDELYPKYLGEKERLDLIDRWYRWTQEDINVQQRATFEHRRLGDLSKTPWLWLVVSSVAQGMYVDGYKSPEDGHAGESTPKPWRTWMANGFDQRQIAIHRGALAYGYAYASALPGTDHTGPTAVMRGISPRNAYAVYEDPAEDDWPMFFIHVHKAPDRRMLVELFDESHRYWIDIGEMGGKAELISSEAHGSEVVPIVRYGMPDLEGRCYGQVEPFIGLASRVNKTTYDRMLTQHFNSWKVITAAGLSKPDSKDEEDREKLKMRHEDILVSESPDTRFGVLQETPLEGFIAAGRFDIETLASVSQTPTYELTGQLVNLSAEALVAARSGLTRKTSEWMRALGSQHARLLRLTSYLEGNHAEANDVMGRVTWQDMEIRSISQAVDALGKAAQMLGVPAEALWGRIPGVESTDVEEWKQMREEQEYDSIDRYRQHLESQAQVGDDEAA